MAAKRPALPALTGMRFFAALAVLSVHFGRWLVPLGPWHTLVGHGGAAVGFFFVLSGFILTYTYGTPDQAMRGGALAFYRARFARVYPVYLLALLFMLCLPDPIFPAASRSAALLPTLGLVQAWDGSLIQAINDPGWSLSAEAFFYTLFPLLLPICLRLSRRQQVWLIAVLWLGAGLVQRDAALIGLGDQFDVLPLARLPEFIIGIVACGLWAKRGGPVWSAGRCDLVALSTGGTALGLLAFAPPAWGQVLLTDGLAPLWALLLGTLALGRGRIAAILGTRALVTLGAASYSLYILHWPIWCGLAALSGRPTPILLGAGWFFGAYVLIAVGASLLVYRAVEEPARKALRVRVAGFAHPP